MKPVLTPAEASALDRATQDEGVTAEALMERAGEAVARAAVEVAGGVYGRRAVVICGSGNNGGDGFVAARHLARLGIRVDVVTVGDRATAPGPAAASLDRLAEQRIVAERFAEGPTARALERADVGIDAIFGTGFHGSPEGEWREAIAGLNASAAPVVAVDIASGIDGATGAIEGEAIRAELTVAFGAAKLGSVLLPGAVRSGTIRVVDIGLSEALMPTETGLTEDADVAAVLPTRSPEGHKRSTGVLLAIAGSRAMTGAPSLIAGAAGRLGAGLVTVATAEGAVPGVQSHAVEAVYLPLAETDAGSIATDALDGLLEAIERADAVAVGPGLTRDTSTAKLVRSIVARAPAPIVLDADGLNAFEGDLETLRRREAGTVLTPHDGEFARLMLHPVDGFPDRVSAARALAEASGAVALLKGTRTVIADPEGRARINVTGTPSLATAGTGDVLTGMIGALLARGLAPFDAAIAGAYLHGLAGLAAGAELGEGVLAGDVVERLPGAVEAVLAR